MDTLTLNGKVLIIEDDEIFSQILARSLTRFGLTVEASLNSEDALKKCHTQKPQYIVLDLKLGTGSGLQLINPLLEIVPNCKILVLTGYASIATAVEAIRLGAHNYLPKPADARTIAEALTGELSAKDTPLPANPMSVDRLEWEHIQKTLLQHEGNISATARTLNMHRRTLQRKLGKKPVQK
ncbi:MAG: response regulator transcription factor [Alteromonadaceae bacterium]|nr:response regulator transcription factor [Alteromonadaceae bacterium]